MMMMMMINDDDDDDDGDHQHRITYPVQLLFSSFYIPCENNQTADRKLIGYPVRF